MKVDKNNPAVELAFTSLKGTKVYTLKDITTISANRGNHAEKMKRFASMCLTESELKRLLEVALSGVNKSQPDIAQAISILHELKFRAEMICEEKSLLELAYTYLFIEGEDHDIITNEYIQKKKLLCESQTDLRAFFLQWALSSVKNFSQKQGADLLIYLEETKNLAQRIEMFLM